MNGEKMSEFDKIFGGGIPLRRKLKVRGRINQQGRIVNDAKSGEAIYQNNTSFDELAFENDGFYDGCNCNQEKPLGGICAEMVKGVRCNQVSCSHHFGHCSSPSCFRPVCLEHSYFIDGNRFCQSCFNRLHRKSFRQRLFVGFLRLFAELDEEKRE